ncbi:MAG: bifunctional adenosylcobinamide kinase/adenosylcobinamide-phosphate guanylyltransferase [Micromonosporaceae bacterium]
MDVLVRGTGGPDGYPQPDCRCASCSAARREGVARAPAELLIDGIVPIGGARSRAPAPLPGGYHAEQVTGGLEITAPDGSRLLWAAAPGAAPEPPERAAPYDVALLDLLADPGQLGGLRRRGLVTSSTTVAAIHIDHRAPSRRELERRLRMWRVTPLDDGSRLTVSPGGRDGLRGLPRPQAPWRVLMLGGASSGKSREAELRLAGEPEVIYVAASGPAAPGGAEWERRVAAHMARRPAWWRTEETTDVAAVLRAATGPVLVDSIGTWLAAVMDECGLWRCPPGEPAAARRLAGRIGELVAAWREARSCVIAVSDEAGSGVVPGTESGRIFRDELGRLNQILVAESEEALLVVAGRVLPLPGLAESC